MIMNFKEAYKNMENDIHGDRAILHSILNGEATKKKKHEFYFKPVFATALAAVFVMCVATIYQNTGIDNYSPSGGAGNAENSVTSQVPDSMIEESESAPAPSAAPSAIGNSESDSSGKKGTEIKGDSKKDSDNKTQKPSPETSGANGSYAKSNDKTSKDSARTDIEKSQNNSGESNVQISGKTSGKSGKSAGESQSKTETVTESKAMPAPKSKAAPAPESKATPAPESKSAQARAHGGGISEMPNAQVDTDDKDLMEFMMGKSPNGNIDSYDPEEEDSESSMNTPAMASSKTDDVISKISVPDDMSFGAGVAHDNDSTVYTAVSEDDPERQIIVIVSENDDSQNDFPDAHHVQSGDEYISVIAENVTPEELNDVIDSLN